MQYAWKLHLFLVLLMSQCYAHRTSGQLAVLRSPFATSSGSFFENIGSGFNVGTRGSGGFFFRGPGPAPLPFFNGTFSDGATFGFGIRGGDIDLSFNLSAVQARNRQFASQTSMLTVPNGGTGQLIHASFRPFVVGIVPVVGSRPTPGWSAPISPVTVALQRISAGAAPAAMARRQDAVKSSAEATGEMLGTGGLAKLPSSAERGDVSVAEIRREQRAQDDQRQSTAATIAARAQSAEARGKTGAARVLYRMAVKKARGQLKERLLRKLDGLSR